MATYLGGKDATVTISGQVQSVTGGTVDEVCDSDDISSTTSGGTVEEFLTLKQLMLAGMEIVFNADAVPTWGAGDQISASYSCPGGPSFTIPSLNVKKVSHKFVDPRGALRLTIDANSSGPYTFSLG